MSMKLSELFSLDLKDLIRGVITAVLTGTFFAVCGIFTTVGFDVFSADWSQIGRMAVNGGFAGLVGYIIKRFFSNKEGEFLGAKSL